jgi:hypothetical protein
MYEALVQFLEIEEKKKSKLDFMLLPGATRIYNVTYDLSVFRLKKQT